MRAVLAALRSFFQKLIVDLEDIASVPQPVNRHACTPNLDADRVHPSGKSIEPPDLLVCDTRDDRRRDGANALGI
jgi:hypothetical protein